MYSCYERTLTTTSCSTRRCTPPWPAGETTAGAAEGKMTLGFARPVSLHVAQANGLAQPSQRITRRNELLPDVAAVVDLQQLAHDGGVLDLLPLVQLAATGVAGRVDVADDVTVLLDAADHVAVHDLNMIDVKKKF